MKKYKIRYRIDAFGSLMVYSGLDFIDKSPNGHINYWLLVSKDISNVLNWTTELDIII